MCAGFVCVIFRFSLQLFITSMLYVQQRMTVIKARVRTKVKLKVNVWRMGKPTVQLLQLQVSCMVVEFHHRLLIASWSACLWRDKIAESIQFSGPPLGCRSNHNACCVCI